MTERERWVVYPLLFLALGAALRDKLVDRTTAKSIVCQELTIVEDDATGSQPGRVLAKIGRTEPHGDAPSNGYFVLNGQLEIVDHELLAEEPVHSIIKLGRSEPAGATPSGGFVAVNGQILVNGQVLVNGIINSKQYAYQGYLFMPSFGAMPGVPTPTLQAAPGRGQPDAQDAQSPDAQPPAKLLEESPDSGPKGVPSNSKSDDDATPKK